MKETQIASTSDRYRNDCRRRLVIACAISAFVLSGLLSVIPYPDFGGFKQFRPSIFDVTIQQPENTVARELPKEPQPAAQPEDDVTPESTTETDIEPEAMIAEDERYTEPEPQPTAEQSVDWYALLDATARNSDALTPAEPSLSAEFDDKRRMAAARYSKPDTREPRPIWENVEKDQLGRTILRSGDCWRVLDDPNVTNEWVQRTFGQYIVYCAYVRSTPKQLPWVKEIVARYEYLQDDNELTEDQR